MTVLSTLLITPVLGITPAADGLNGTITARSSAEVTIQIIP